MPFDHPAKSGVQRQWEVDDPALAGTVRALMGRDGRSGRLPVCGNGSGSADVHAAGLGNTPAVAPQLVHDSRVVTVYGNGVTMSAAAGRCAKTRGRDENQAILEAAAARMIGTVAKG